MVAGHNADVHDIKADWDLNLVVTASWDHTLGMFDLRSGKRIRTMKGHSTVINSVDVCFGQMLALSFAEADFSDGKSQNTDFILWDLRDGRIVNSYPGHEGGTNCGVVNWQTHQAVTGGVDSLVKFWDLATAECTKTIDCDHMQTLALDVNWERGVLLTGSWNSKTRVWDINTGKMTHKLKKPRRCITQVALMGGRGSG